MTDLTFDSFEVVPVYAILGSRRRPGRRITPSVQFVVVHDTGNPGASARNHAKFYRNDPNPPNATLSSAHIFVDDREIIETIPALTGAAPEQALHVLKNKPKDNELFGHDANRAAVGIELCFGGSIDPDEAYKRYVWTIAKTCKKYGLDPSRRIVGHQVLDPKRKVDPGQALRKCARSYEGLLRDVVAVYRECEGGAGQIGTARIATGSGETTVHLVVRTEPRRLGAKLETLTPGTRVNILQVVQGEAVNGNDDWCEIAPGRYCWSGGLELKTV